MPERGTSHPIQRGLSRRRPSAASLARRGQAWVEDDRWRKNTAWSFLRVQSKTIAGGTSDIQRNIIGERVLGLPKEPDVDRDLPWSQVRHS